VAMPIGVVQSLYPEMRGGYISAGMEGGSALFFSFDSVIGPNVMRGDSVRLRRPATGPLAFNLSQRFYRNDAAHLERLHFNSTRPRRAA
jgi:hypothetical protein